MKTTEMKSFATEAPVQLCPDEDHATCGQLPRRQGRRGGDEHEVATPTDAIQMFADAVNTGITDVHAAASRGISGGGGDLPHRAAIQMSFGRHDIGHVRAHVGGEAASASRAMGARAYATGSSVAFASSPDLHLAAHEAAHIVQQKGGVQLKGGVGQAGDAYEQHADAVADKVVRGESAESLLDQFAGGGAGGSAIQMCGGPGEEPCPDAATGRAGGHGADGGAAGGGPAPEAERRLVADIVQAIAMNEIGGRDHAIESTMGTSSGMAASYASATQMVASHATTTLRRAPGVAAAHGLDRRELRDADRIMRASQRIWDAVVLHGTAFGGLDHDDIELTHFTEEDVAHMARMGRFRARVLAERSRFEHAGARAHEIAMTIAHELSTDADVVAMGLSEHDVLAYIHDGRMNRFAEDRNSWNRVALSRTNEHTAMDGAAPRSLEDAIESAAEADNGWALSRVDFQRMVHTYLTSHPGANDEAVVRYCAAHNGHSSDYPDRIWRNFQRVRGGG